MCVQGTYSASGFSKRRYAGVRAASGPTVREAINDENSDGIVNPRGGPALRDSPKRYRYTLEILNFRFFCMQRLELIVLTVSRFWNIFHLFFRQNIHSELANLIKPTKKLITSRSYKNTRAKKEEFN